VAKFSGVMASSLLASFLSLVSRCYGLMHLVLASFQRSQHQLPSVDRSVNKCYNLLNSGDDGY